MTEVKEVQALDKPGWFMRVVRRVTPRKWHPYYTKEAIFAYNFGSLTTDIKWLGILAVPWDAVTPVLRVYWTNIVTGVVHVGRVAKEAFFDFLTILSNGT